MAEELHEVREGREDDFHKVVDDLQFTERLSTVTARVETYQGKNRVKFMAEIVFLRTTVGC
jgi:hypothetical protein